ncbi:MAG: hypothetical protein ACK559_29245, partial [bacterium]
MAARPEQDHRRPAQPKQQQNEQKAHPPSPKPEKQHGQRHHLTPNFGRAISVKIRLIGRLARSASSGAASTR